MLSRELVNRDHYLQSKKSNLRDYLNSINSNAVQDLSKATFLLNSKLKETEKIDLVNSLIEIGQEIERNRIHTKGYRADPYTLFCSKFGKYQLTRKDFIQYYQAVNYLNTEVNIPIIDAKMEQVLSDFAKLQLDKEEQYKFIDMMSSARINPTEILHTLGNSSDKTRTVNILNLINSAKRVDKMKLLTIVDTDEKNNDVALENSIVYQANIKNSILSYKKEKQVALIEPGVLFIDKFLRDKNTTGFRTNIVLANHNIRHICERAYSGVPNTFFYDYETFSESISSMDIGNAVVFANRIKDKISKKKTFDAMNDLYRVKTLIFDGDYEFVSKNSAFNSFVRENEIGIKSVTLLPSLKNATNPKRKMLIELGKIGEYEDCCKVYSYSLKTDNYSDGYLELSSHLGEVSREDFLSGNFKIRNEYRESNSEFSSKNERSKGEEIEFSGELGIYYTKSFSAGNYRVSALMVFNDGVSKRKIKETAKSKRFKSELEIKEWLINGYPYESFTNPELGSVRDIVAKVTNKELSTGSVTLKTYEYIHGEVENGYSDELVRSLHRVIENEMKYVTVQNITVELVKNSIYDENYYDESFTKKMIEVLSCLLDIAVKDKSIRNNCLKDEVKRYSQNDEHFAEVRNNLVYKQLSIKKFNTLLEYLLKRYSTNENLYLALLLKATLGLESNIVCGLKWGDLEHVYVSDDKEFMTLNICRQLQNNGRKLRPFIRKESYRKIPVNNLVASKIVKLKQKIMTEKGISEDELAEMPLIKGNVKCEDSYYPVYEPAKLTKLANKIVKDELMLIRKEIVFLPSNSGGTIETNFNNYNGDFLRSNYEHHMSSNVTDNEDDIDYLLGRKAESTYACHYYDYENDYSQYLLYLLQNALIEKIKENEVKSNG